MIEIDWRGSVRVEGISQSARVRVLSYVKEKVGFTRLCEELGISKASLHRYLSGESEDPG